MMATGWDVVDLCWAIGLSDPDFDQQKDCGRLLAHLMAINPDWQDNIPALLDEARRWIAAAGGSIRAANVALPYPRK